MVQSLDGVKWSHYYGSTVRVTKVHGPWGLVIFKETIVRGKYTEDKTLLKRVGINCTHVRVIVCETMEKTNQLWSGGCRNTYAHRKTDTGECVSESHALGPGTMIVEYRQVGAKVYVYVYLHPDDEKLFDYPVYDGELTELEGRALRIMAGFKSAYRLREWESFGHTVDMWHETIKSLIGKGLVSKAKSLTMMGRNLTCT